MTQAQDMQVEKDIYANSSGLEGDHTEFELGDGGSRGKYDLKRIYLFQDAFRCAAAQFGVETNHPEFVGLGTMVTSTQLAHFR